MKKLSVKIKTLIALCALLMVCVVFGGMAMQVNAQGVTPATASFTMVQGASVRATTNADNDSNGIRFSITMPKSEYNELKTNYSDITFGILIAPASYEDTAELNEANVFGESAVYDWATLQDGEWVYEDNGKTRIINFETAIMVEDSKNADYVIYHGSMVGLREENIDREFIAKGYMKYTDGTVKYEWADQNDNVRSMAYVAQLAVNSTQVSNDQKTVLNNLYLNRFAETSVNYTVEHYTENAPGSAEPYTLNSSTTPSGTFNTTVTATVADIDGFELDTENSVTEGTALINDKLTLKLYYNKVVDVIDALSFTDPYDAKIATSSVETPKIVDDSNASGGKALQGVYFFENESSTSKPLTISLGGTYKISQIVSVSVKFKVSTSSDSKLCAVTFNENYSPASPSKWDISGTDIDAISEWKTWEYDAARIAGLAGGSIDTTLNTISFYLNEGKGGTYTIRVDSIVITLKQQIENVLELLDFNDDSSLDLVTSASGTPSIVDDAKANDGKALEGVFEKGTDKALSINLGGVYKIGEIELITIRFKVNATASGTWPCITFNGSYSSSKPSQFEGVNTALDSQEFKEWNYYTPARIKELVVGSTDDTTLNSLQFYIADGAGGTYTMRVDSIVITLKQQIENVLELLDFNDESSLDLVTSASGTPSIVDDSYATDGKALQGVYLYENDSSKPLTISLGGIYKISQIDSVSVKFKVSTSSSSKLCAVTFNENYSPASPSKYEISNEDIDAISTWKTNDYKPSRIAELAGGSDDTTLNTISFYLKEGNGGTYTIRVDSIVITLKTA